MTESPLSGRVVWVTGSARRVGRAIALRCAEAGADIIVHCRGSRSEAESVAAEITGMGRRAHVVQGDHAHEDDVRRMVGEIDAEFGRLDALVNSASSYPRRAFAETGDADFTRAIDDNLRGPFLCARLALPLLQATPHACIVNLLDAALSAPTKEFAAYWCAKGGLDALTRALARELAPEIRVNSVSPGPVLAPEDLDSATREAILRRVPLGRWGTPEAVAEAVLFLLRDDYVTGTDVCVDGGRRLG